MKKFIVLSLCILAFTFAKSQDLIESEVPIVKVYPEKSSKWEFVIADKVEGDINLSVFLYKHHEYNQSLGDKEFKKMVKELKKFMVLTYQFETIDDFKAEQLIWDSKNRRWVLLDWLQYMVKFDHSESDRFAYEVDEFFQLAKKVLSKSDIRKIKKKVMKKVGINEKDFYKNTCLRLATSFMNGHKVLPY